MLDAMEESWVSVLVPWNRHDELLAVAEGDLRDRMNHFLGRKLSGIPRRYPSAGSGIPTMQDFRSSRT